MSRLRNVTDSKGDANKLLLPIGIESKALKKSLLESTLWLGQGLTPPPQIYWVIHTMLDIRALWLFFSCLCTTGSWFDLNQGHTHKVLFQEVAFSSHHVSNPARCFCAQKYFNVAKCCKSWLYLRHRSPCGMTPRPAWIFAFLFAWKVNDCHTYPLHPSKVPHLLQSVRSRLCTTILSWPRWTFLPPSLPHSQQGHLSLLFLHSFQAFFLSWGLYTYCCLWLEFFPT